ncbi:hypothetical protein Tco_0710339 [Tanacetum coccineum]
MDLNGPNKAHSAAYSDLRVLHTPLTKTPKKILAMEAGKGIFTPHPLMPGSPESRNKNKYCDFHRDKCHNTDNCLHLKRQIEEAVKSRHLAHLVKEIKQGSNKVSTSKPVKRQKQPKTTKELLSHPDIGGNTACPLVIIPAYTNALGAATLRSYEPKGLPVLEHLHRADPSQT